MKTDRELLELAARAAGYEGSWRKHWRSGTASYMLFAYPERFVVGRKEWNPIEDDGDALRLAVLIGIGTMHHQGWGQVFHPYIQERIDFEYGSDEFAATRRAIVRSAAEIQLQKERER